MRFDEILDLAAKAIPYKCVPGSENDMDFRVAEPHGQNRIDDPYNETRIYFADCFLNKVLAK